MNTTEVLARATRRLVAILIFAAAVPSLASAQIGVGVQGRVYDADSDREIRNALVTLQGHGATLTSVLGTFRFAGVEPGVYTLDVEALGYDDVSISVSVVGDTTISVPLEVAPLPLDPLIVEAETLDFDGRVRDLVRDSYVLDAHIRTDQDHEEWSHRGGRFDLDDVLAETPMRVFIQAFGYLTLDTILVPDDEERYVFDLMPDPFMEGLIEIQVERIENRAGELLYESRPPLNRDDMARYTGFGTLSLMIEARYPRLVLEGLVCLIFDEQEIEGWDRGWLLNNTIPEELERVEVLEFPGPARLFMLRVYSRVFFQHLVNSNQSLRTPVLHEFTGSCN